MAKVETVPMCANHEDRPAEFEVVETFCGVPMPVGRPLCAECAESWHEVLED